MPLNGTTRDATTAVKGKSKLANHLGGTADAPTIAWTYNPYCFRAYCSSGTTISDGAGTKVLFATEDYDYNSNFATSTYTAPVSGVYHFDGRVGFGTAISTGALAVPILYVNSSEAARGNALGSGYTSSTTYVLSADVFVTAGHAVELWMFQDSAGTEITSTGTAETFFAGHLVHRTA